jgi:peptidoglycan hydrolase-like protein with peptidoglycan-binding domain
MTSFDPNITIWIQGGMNLLVTPSPNLTVDGIYGPLTRKAVQDFQTQQGLTPDGWAGRLTQGLIDALMAKLQPQAASLVPTAP